MNTEVEGQLLSRLCETLVQQGRLVELPAQGQVVFVGDTHGDLEATQHVLDRYLKDTLIVFLGDYVDRGPHSLENLQLLLSTKLEHPDRIYLLQGNHEGWGVLPFSPADFWEGLEPGRREMYAQALLKLPLAVTAPNGILALHAALPALGSLELIKDVEPGSDLWRQITWGDWQESKGFVLGDWGSRPQFGRGYFDFHMQKLGKNMLIRSHQPHAPLLMYDRRCVTIFTSSAYGSRERRVAVAWLELEVKNGEDLQFVEI